MTIAEQLRKEGRKEGLEKGIKKGLKKGREEGRLAALRSLIVFKFQTIGPTYEAQLKRSVRDRDHWDADRSLKLGRACHCS